MQIFNQKGSRSSYANWLASEANPRFTTVIVNSLWKEVFGLALVEPLDNMFDDTMATHPELQLHLEKVMVALNYDLRNSFEYFTIHRLSKEMALS